MSKLFVLVVFFLPILFFDPHPLTHHDADGAIVEKTQNACPHHLHTKKQSGSLKHTNNYTPHPPITRSPSLCCHPPPYTPLAQFRSPFPRGRTTHLHNRSLHYFYLLPLVTQNPPLLPQSLLFPLPVRATNVHRALQHTPAAVAAYGALRNPKMLPPTAAAFRKNGARHPTTHVHLLPRLMDTATVITLLQAQTTRMLLE